MSAGRRLWRADVGHAAPPEKSRPRSWKTSLEPPSFRLANDKTGGKNAGETPALQKRECVLNWSTCVAIHEFKRSRHKRHCETRTQKRRFETQGERVVHTAPKFVSAIGLSPSRPPRRTQSPSNGGPTSFMPCLSNRLGSFTLASGLLVSWKKLSIFAAGVKANSILPGCCPR